MDCGIRQSRPISSPMHAKAEDDPPSKTKGRSDFRDNCKPRRSRNGTGHLSSGSCRSTRSLSSAASTKTHRRCRVEVSSVLFGRCNEPAPSAQRPVGGEGLGVDAPSERRGPGSDRLASASSCSRVSADTWDFGGAGSGRGRRLTVASPKGKQLQIDAVELIRELSFSSDARVPRRTPASDRKNESSLSSNNSSSSVSPEEIWGYGSSGSNCSNGSFVLHEPSGPEVGSDLPPLPLPPSPSLPPSIKRLGHHFVDVPCQVMHKRNRTRSTSISEMSESYLNEFVCDPDESSPKTGSSHGTSSSCDKEVMDAERKSLITIENNLELEASSPPVLAPRPGPGLWNRTRSAGTVVSGQSSYFSSTSSSSGNPSPGSLDDCVEDQDQGSIEDASLPQSGSGYLSLQEGMCSTFPPFDGNAEPGDRKVSQPRLNAETLRKWNIMCEEELTKKGVTRDQFIFRAVSCPNRICGVASPERERTEKARADRRVDDGELARTEERHPEAEWPHPSAPGLCNVVTQSLFSYTNSGATSTISSRCKNDLDEVVSDLDFDMQFIYSYSIDNKSSFGAPLDGGTDRPGNGHRRSLSSGSRLGRPTAAPPNSIPNQERPLDEARLAQKHRRFRSEGSIEVNLSFAEDPPFKSKYSTLHHRGRSLGSFKEHDIFDCSQLQCILEEGSKGSNSADGAGRVGLGSWINRRLEEWSPICVLRLGFVLGLLVGLLMPFSTLQVRWIHLPPNQPSGGAVHLEV